MILKILSFIALVGTIVPSLFVFVGEMSLENAKLIMTSSMVLWFLTAPFWINGKKRNKSANS